MLLGTQAELPAQLAGDLLHLAGERGGQALRRGENLARSLLHQCGRFAPRLLLLLSGVAASAFPPLERLPRSDQYRALIVEHLPDRAEERVLVAAHCLRPSLASLVEGLPEVAGHGAQLLRCGVQQLRHRPDPCRGGGQAIDATLQTGSRLDHRLRLRSGRRGHVLDAPVQLRERIGEAPHGFAKRLAQLVADRVGELLLGCILVAAGLQRLPEVVQRLLEAAIGEAKEAEGDHQVVRHAEEAGDKSGREGSQHAYFEGGHPPQPDRKRGHGAADADDEGRCRPHPHAIDPALVHPVGLVHVAHPVGAVAAFRPTPDVVLEGVPQAVELRRLVRAGDGPAAPENRQLEHEHEKDDGIDERHGRPGE